MLASTGLQLCLFFLALFFIHTFASWSPEASDSDLQVKSSDQKAAADITDAEEATQKGIQVALHGFKHEANLRLFSLDLIEEALQYFGRAVDLQPTSTIFHLNKLLTQSLIAEKKADDEFKRRLITQFQDLAAQKRKGSQNHRDLALVEFYLGYMLEILLEDVKAAKAQWKVVRAFGFSDLEENFWDDEAAPKGYIRFETPPKNYKNFLHPFVVYLFLRDQYLDQVDAGPVPQFPSDETVLRETHSNPILRVEAGFDIQMGRQSLDSVNKFFKENEFVVLRHFFSQEEVNMLTEYYQTHVYGLWRESYDPTLMRTNVYNDRLGFFTNKRKEALLNQITFPRPVKMSYAFLCHYEDLGQQGESYNNGRPNLRPHTDRKDNEITVTVTMTSPIWPIFVHTKKVPAGSAWRERPAWEESVEVDLQAGDALIFSGRSHTHWREALPLQIDKYSSMLYHYVDREFDFVKFRQVGEQGDY